MSFQKEGNPKYRTSSPDGASQSDGSFIVKLEDLINMALGPTEKNTVNFKLIQLILHILARNMRLLDHQVELRSSDVTLPQLPTKESFKASKLESKGRDITTETGKGKEKADKPKDREASESNDKKETKDTATPLSSIDREIAAEKKGKEKSDKPKDRKVTDRDDKKETKDTPSPVSSIDLEIAAEKKGKEKSDKPKDRKVTDRDDKKETKDTPSPVSSIDLEIAAEKKGKEKSDKPKDRKVTDRDDKKETKDTPSPVSSIDLEIAAEKKGKEKSDKPKDRKVTDRNDEKETKDTPSPVSSIDLEIAAEKKGKEKSDKPKDRKVTDRNDEKETKDTPSPVSSIDLEIAAEKKGKEKSDKPKDRKVTVRDDKKETKDTPSPVSSIDREIAAEKKGKEKSDKSKDRKVTDRVDRTSDREKTTDTATLEGNTKGSVLSSSITSDSSDDDEEAKINPYYDMYNKLGKKMTRKLAYIRKIYLHEKGSLSASSDDEGKEHYVKDKDERSRAKESERHEKEKAKLAKLSDTERNIYLKEKEEREKEKLNKKMEDESDKEKYLKQKQKEMKKDKKRADQDKEKVGERYETETDNVEENVKYLEDKQQRESGGLDAMDSDRTEEGDRSEKHKKKKRNDKSEKTKLDAENKEKQKERQQYEQEMANIAKMNNDEKEKYLRDKEQTRILKLDALDIERADSENYEKVKAKTTVTMNELEREQNLKKKEDANLDAKYREKQQRDTKIERERPKKEMDILADMNDEKRVKEMKQGERDKVDFDAQDRERAGIEMDEKEKALFAKLNETEKKNYLKQREKERREKSENDEMGRKRAKGDKKREKQQEKDRDTEREYEHETERDIEYGKDQDTEHEKEQDKEHEKKRDKQQEKDRKREIEQEEDREKQLETKSQSKRDKQQEKDRKREIEQEEDREKQLETKSQSKRDKDHKKKREKEKEDEETEGQKEQKKLTEKVREVDLETERDKTYPKERPKKQDLEQKKQREENQEREKKDIEINLKEKDLAKVGGGRRGQHVDTQIRVGSIAVVTRSEFELLEAKVNELQEKTAPIPYPSMPDNEKLRTDLARGSASLTDTMQAMQVSARVQATETAMARMADLLTQLAAAGALPQDVVEQVEEVTAGMGYAAPYEAPEGGGIKSSLARGGLAKSGTSPMAESSGAPGGDKTSRNVAMAVGGPPKVHSASSAPQSTRSLGTATDTRSHISTSALSTSDGVPQKYSGGVTTASKPHYTKLCVTHPELDDAQNDLRDQMIKKAKDMVHTALRLAEIADRNVRQVADQMEIATRVSARVDTLFNLINDYAEQMTGFDVGVSIQLQNFNDQIFAIRTELKEGITLFNQTITNPETEAVRELNQRYGDQVIDLNLTRNTLDKLGYFQSAMGDEFRSLLKIVQELTEEKADRDELLDGLRDKADKISLEGLTKAIDFEPARVHLDQRLHECNHKFNRQEEVWMKALEDLTAFALSKASGDELNEFTYHTEVELNSIKDELQLLVTGLGEPKALLLARKISEGGTCGPCMAPSQQAATADCAPLLLPAAWPKPKDWPSEEPCQPRAIQPREQNEREHVCKRWTGGSHTLVNRNVVQTEAEPIRVSMPPTKKYSGVGSDGKLYCLEEVLQPCSDCNELGKDEEVKVQEVGAGEPGLKKLEVKLN